MQFILKGPDIPNALLQAHEDGQVVFFCGAGISYPAGLPGFESLVKKIFEFNNQSFEMLEGIAFKSNAYDTVLNLLERRLAEPLDLKRCLKDILEPDLSREGALLTHESILKLSLSREKKRKLITTNFDQLFKLASISIKHELNYFAAPYLPITKNSRWDGLVYLHGFLSKSPTDLDLKNLVLTSGDFGRAYLTERWASRFVSDLFKNYTVCFIGYSINDPILRYMMDAIAADRSEGENIPKVWAFADCEEGNENNKKIEWLAKGVTPILYHSFDEGKDHTKLHQTLKVWADTYTDGITGKEKFVLAHAMTRPSDSTKEDDFVGRMMWALTDKSGRPAKVFANYSPTPSIEWLIKPFSEPTFNRNDLIRFGIDDRTSEDNLKFSFVLRPAPISARSYLSFVTRGFEHTGWDKVQLEISNWILRHLNNPLLFLWFVNEGACVNPQLSERIEKKLNEYIRLKKENHEKLRQLAKESPDAIPNKELDYYWRLLISGLFKKNYSNKNINEWLVKLELQGELTTSLRFELRDLLTPLLKVNPRTYLNHTSAIDYQSKLRLQLDLNSVDVKFDLLNSESPIWKSSLPNLLEDFQALLSSSLELIDNLAIYDPSVNFPGFNFPSISSHTQNDNSDNWQVLIELLRDSWLELWKVNKVKAISQAYVWATMPNITLKRLALFCATKEDTINPIDWIGWVLANDADLLWSTEARREVLRLFVLKGAELQQTDQSMIENAIILGKPNENSSSLNDYCVWLRLEKLKLSGLKLSAVAENKLEALFLSNPNFKLEQDESDEFPNYLSTSDQPEFKAKIRYEYAPKDVVNLIDWIKIRSEDQDIFIEDNWFEFCQKHMLKSICALNKLSGENIWPEKFWHIAFQAWSKDSLIKKSYKFVNEIVLGMQSDFLIKISSSLSWWILTLSKQKSLDDLQLLKLCDLILNLEFKRAENNSKYFTVAINHPIGKVTEAICNLWGKKVNSDNQKLSDNFKELFTKIANKENYQLQHGRVILCAQLLYFYRVDVDWTIKNLLPLLSWDHPNESKVNWSGFLVSARLYPPLMQHLKVDFLNCAKNYNSMGEYRRNFIGLLTYAALDGLDGYSITDFKTAFGKLPKECLSSIAYFLLQALESNAGENLSESNTGENLSYSKNRLEPFLKEIWPQKISMIENLDDQSDQNDQNISVLLAKLCLTLPSNFKNIFQLVHEWLIPIDFFGPILYLLKKFELNDADNEIILLFLDKLVKKNRVLDKAEVKDFLEKIISKNQNLQSNSYYLSLIKKLD